MTTERMQQITLDQYEDRLNTWSIDLEMPSYRSDVIENMSLPPLIFTWTPDLAPDDFLVEYSIKCASHVEQFPEEEHAMLYAGIDARAMRGWVALTREYDLYLMLKQNLPVVMRSPDLDYRGVDVVAINKGIAYAIIAYTSTPRGEGFHHQKIMLHYETLKHFRVLSMPLFMDSVGLSKPREIGRIKLYPWSQVDGVSNMIRYLRMGEPLSGSN